MSAGPLTAPAGTVAEALQFISLRGVADVTSERTRFVMPWSMDAMRIWNFVNRQWECRDPDGWGTQWVGTLSSHRLIYIDLSVDFEFLGKRVTTREIAVEVWATEQGYEDRLDQLAQVETAMAT